MTVRQKLERRLETMPGLDCRASRYGEGRSYFVGDREIAHFHGETRLDVRLTKEEIRRHKVDGTLDPRI